MFMEAESVSNWVSDSDPNHGQSYFLAVGHNAESEQNIGFTILIRFVA